ncbi:hypothetical protein [Streptomyces chartreusis]
MPRRTYTRGHWDHVGRALARTVRDAHLIPGLRITEQPALLRQFRSKLAPVAQ